MPKKVDQAAIDAAVVKLMNEEPEKAVMFMVLEAGKMCLSGNVEVMEFAQQLEIKGCMYEVKCLIHVKDISKIIKLPTIVN